MRETITLLAALSAALVLTACGGGSYSDPSPPPPPPPMADPTEVPASVGTSSASLTSYLGGLSATENTEALSLAKVTPVVSETEEPLPVTK